MTKRRSDGEGSVYVNHRPDCPQRENHDNPTCKCKWRGAMVLGYRTSPSGKRTAVRRKVTAATKSGAATRLRELRDKHEAQTLPVGKAPTLEQWLNHCLEKVLPATPSRQGLKENSLRSYRTDIVNYWIPLLGHLRLDRLTSEDIEDAEATLSEIGNPLKGADATHLEPNTVYHAHVVLARCLKLAVHKRLIARNPAGADAMQPPPKGRGEVEPLATGDWKKVLKRAERVSNRPRWTVALAMGLRQGEALGLRWEEDVDLKAGTLHVQQIIYRLTGKGLCFGTPKTARSARIIQLPPELVDQLREHRKAQLQARLAAGERWTDSGLVFTQANGKPIDPREDRKHWHGLLEAAGVKPVKLHAARHTAATMMLLQNIDRRVVMDIMGWSQSSIADNYQHAVTEAQLDAAARIGAAVWG